MVLTLDGAADAAGVAGEWFVQTVCGRCGRTTSTTAQLLTACSRGRRTVRSAFSETGSETGF